MFRRRTGAGLADFSTIDVLRKTQIPVLFFHGGSDKFVPIGMSRANDEAAAGWHRLVSVPGAPHAMSYYVDPAKYESAVREFWSECETVRFIGQDH